MKLRLALAAILLIATPAAARVKPGQPAPAFSVITFEGRTISSDELRGKVVILNYWATWCGPCRVELPDMDTYVRRHPGAPLAIYAIATEGSLPDSKLRPLAAALSFPLIKRMKGGGFGVLQGVPTNYVIDKSGVVRWAKAGAFDLDSLETTITPLLAEPAPTPAPPTTTAAP